MTSREPRNPLYLLLLVVSLLFVATALAYGIIPLMEQRARQAGAAVPPSELRAALRADGWKWLLYELAAMTVLGLASMGLDRVRSLRQERASGTVERSDEAKTKG